MPRRAPGRSAQEWEALLAQREGLVAELRRERDDARAQQDATAAVLRAMRSPAVGAATILGTIAASAGRLCPGATGVTIFRVEGDVLRVAASWTPAGPRRGITVGDTRPLDRRESTAGWAVFDRRTVYVPDLAAVPETVLLLPLSRQLGTRTVASIPLWRGDDVIGAVNVSSLL